MSARTRKQLTSDESIARRHEQADINFNRILIIGFGLLGLMVAGLVSSEIVERLFTNRGDAGGVPEVLIASGDSLQAPPEPRLEPSPNSNLVRYQAWEDSILTMYGWENREEGIVRIPIDSAMKAVMKDRKWAE